MTQRTDIVLFRPGESTGQVAIEIDLIESNDDYLVYKVWFEKKTPIQGPAQEIPQMADMTITPDQVEKMTDGGASPGLPS